jgi:fructokinase
MNNMIATKSPVAIFGEALVDQFSSGPVAGGAPFNVARHLAALGHAPLMLTAIGQDASGALIEAGFAHYGMTQAGLQRRPDIQTGVVDVITDERGQPNFDIRPSCAYDHIDRTALGAVAEGLDPSGWLYYGSLALRSPVSLATWQALADAHPGPRFMDLNWREGHTSPEVALMATSRAHVLKVNEGELGLLLDWTGQADVTSPATWQTGAIDPLIAGLMAGFSLDTLIVTCGADGYAGFAAGGLCIARGAGVANVHVVDTVGAGDSFSAVVLAGQLRGWPWPQTLARANTYAARVCALRGAMPAHFGEHAQWTRDWYPATQ